MKTVKLFFYAVAASAMLLQSLSAGIVRISELAGPTGKKVIICADHHETAKLCGRLQETQSFELFTTQLNKIIHDDSTLLLSEKLAVFTDEEWLMNELMQPSTPVELRFLSQMNRWILELNFSDENFRAVDFRSWCLLSALMESVLKLSDSLKKSFELFERLYPERKSLRSFLKDSIIRMDILIKQTRLVEKSNVMSLFAKKIKEMRDIISWRKEVLINDFFTEALRVIMPQDGRGILVKERSAEFEELVGIFNRQLNRYDCEIVDFEILFQILASQENKRKIIVVAGYMHAGQVEKELIDCFGYQLVRASGFNEFTSTSKMDGLNFDQFKDIKNSFCAKYRMTPHSQGFLVELDYEKNSGLYFHGKPQQDVELVDKETFNWILE